jgi:LmbE family N-acetylglucosaminyl deacetylase
VKLLGFNSVLCLSPHPDDVEFAMGGTILKYKDTKFTSIVFSTGSINDPVANEDRWKECEEYWKGTANITQYFIAPLLRMYSEEEWINLLERDHSIKNFDAIFLPPFSDTHFEHRFVHGIGMAMTRNTPVSIIEYKPPSAYDVWVANLIVDIKETADVKTKKLNKFESQRKLYFKPGFMQGYHTHVSSLKKGIETVEQFKITTLYPCKQK